jgi:YfiH family protein
MNFYEFINLHFRKFAMIKKRIGNITFLFSPNLSRHRELTHAISTREGGVSSGNYNSLNLSFRVGDEQNKVIKNHQILSQTLGFDLSSLVTCQQIHQDAVARVDKSYFKKDCFLPNNSIPKTDALVTDVPGITLMTRYADCVPLLFYEPKAQAVAIAHAGWEGTLAGIGQKTVNVLVYDYHCQPQHILAAIGPSIGPCCYQINSTMAEHALKKLPWAQEYIRESSDEGLYFNLRQANKKQLKSAGIKDEQLYCTELCTSCKVDLFFSYRKEKRVTGRFGALIGLIDKF